MESWEMTRLATPIEGKQSHTLTDAGRAVPAVTVLTRMSLAGTELILQLFRKRIIIFKRKWGACKEGSQEELGIREMK